MIETITRSKAILVVVFHFFFRKSLWVPISIEVPIFNLLSLLWPLYNKCTGHIDRRMNYQPYTLQPTARELLPSSVSTAIPSCRAVPWAWQYGFPRPLAAAEFASSCTVASPAGYRIWRPRKHMHVMYSTGSRAITSRQALSLPNDR